MSSEDLEDAENEAGAPNTSVDAAEEAVGSGSSVNENEANGDFGYHEEKGEGNGAPLSKLGGLKGKIGGGLTKRGLVFGGIGGSIIIIILVLAMFLGTLKNVHFATIMRNAGFATSQLVMRKQFSQIGYENAVLTEDSVRGLTAPERTMFDRLRRINPQKTMDMMGESGNFKVYQDADGIKGFELKGKRFLIDDYAKPFSKERFGDLTWREKLTVKNQILGDINYDLAEVLKAEPRSFRNGFFKAFREHFGIKNTKWANAARALIGKTPDEALAKTREEVVKRVRGESNIPGSSIDNVEEGAKGVDDAIDNDAKNNLRKRSKAWLDEGLKKAGRESGIKSLEDDLAKFSTAALIATIYCMLHDANNAINESNPSTEERAQRLSHDIQTTGDQTKLHKVSAEAVGASAALWDGSNDAPPATDSPLYQEAAYGNVSGFSDASTENLPTAKIDKDEFARMLGTVDGFITNALSGGFGWIPGVKKLTEAVLNEGCRLIMSPGGMMVVVGIELLGTIMTSGGSEGFLVATGTALKTLVKGVFSKKGLTQFGLLAGGGLALRFLVILHSNASFSGAETGEDLYSSGAIATNYQNAATGRGVAYGKPLTPEESRSTRKTAMQDMRSMYKQKPWDERYFATDNPYSLLGRFAAKVPTSFSSGLLSLRAGVSNLGSMLASLFSGKNNLLLAFWSTGFGQKAYAATSSDIMADYDYFGIEQWGWSPEELYKLDNDESYGTLQNGGWVIERNQNGELDEKYQDCFTKPAQTDVPEKCYSKGDKKDRLDLGSEEALRWRLYKLHTSIIDQLADTTVTGGSTTPPPTPSPGSTGISPDGFVFPQSTTKSKVKIGAEGSVWCFEKQTSCHHDYNAADIFAPTGTEVLAARGGKVMRAVNNHGGDDVGSRVTIKGDDGLVYYYAHMGEETLEVKAGDTVKAGQLIGRVGTREDAVDTPPHTHFDVLPSNYDSRVSCSGSACSGYPFINVQPSLISAFNNLAE